MYSLKGVHIRIGDTMGIEPYTTETDIRNILSVLEGHVPNGYEFKLGEEFHSKSQGYIPKPSLGESAHCVGLVINAKDTSTMSENLKSNLKSLAEALINRGLPLVVILTHLDELYPEVGEDVTKTFHSKGLHDIVTAIRTMVGSIQENQIFPVINYQKDVELDDSMDILLLYALQFMVVAANDYLEKQKESSTYHMLSHPKQEQGATSK